MSNELYVELAAKIRVLELQVHSQDRLLQSLYMVIPLTARADFCALLRAHQLSAEAEDGADDAQYLQLLANRVAAQFGPDLKQSAAQVTVSILASALQHASVPEHLRQALQTWLSIASDDELAQDITDTLKSALDAGGAANKQGKPDA